MICDLMFATATECSRAPARHRGGSLATPVSVYGRQLVRLGQESLSRAVLVVRWSMNRHIHVSVLEAVIGFHRLAKKWLRIDAHAEGAGVIEAELLHG